MINKNKGKLKFIKNFTDYAHNKINKTFIKYLDTKFNTDKYLHVKNTMLYCA